MAVIRLSFICHSLGGLIVRAALPLLEDLSDRMGVLVTLMTPHLGISDICHGKVTGFGAKIYSKVTKHEALRQMIMADAKEPKDRFLYKLSKMPGLEWFQKVLLVSSYQDHYCPYDSARVEVGEWSCCKGYEIFDEMVANILEKIDPHNLVRIDLHVVNDSIIDGTLGRKPHMVLIEDFTCQLLFATTYYKYFN